MFESVLRIAGALRRQSARRSAVAPKSALLRIENLEERQLLSVTPAEYAAIREAYPHLELPESSAGLNIIELPATDLTVSALQGKINEAAATEQPDLLVVRTIEDAHTITYSSESDTVMIDYSSEEYGSLAIVAFGSEPLTINGANLCPGVYVGTDAEVGIAGLEFEHCLNGAIYACGSTVIEQTVFADNTAVHNGAAVMANRASVSIYDSMFVGNTSNFGGALYLFGPKFTISGSVFRNNNAVQLGGSIFVGYAISTQISHSDFNGNKALAGGAIHARGSISISDSRITNNASDLYGGAVLSDGGVLTIVNSEISGNNADYGGGIFVNCNTSLTNCTVAGNSAQEGGGVYFSESEGARLSLCNTIVSQNYAKDEENGINIQGTVGESFSSIVDSDPGFAVAPVFDDEGKLTNADAVDLHLTAASLAVDAGRNNAVEGAATDLDGNSRIFASWFPVPTVDIGAYEYRQAQEWKAISCVVTTAEDAIRNDGKTSLREALAYAQDGDTITFAPELKGTAIELVLGELVVDKAITIDASALWDDEKDAPGLTVSGLNKTRAFTINVDAKFVGLEISQGQAETGAAIYGDFDGSLAIEKCVFTENASASYGGAVRLIGGDLTISDSLFSGNSAGNEGGAVKTHGTSVRISGTVFAGNTSADVGGAAQFYDASSIEITDSFFTENVSEKDGGAVYISGGVVGVISSVFADNTASWAGGALAILGDEGVSIKGSEFTGNTGSQGGAVFFATHAVKEITGSTFADNKATENGGAVSVYQYNSGGVIHGGSLVVDDSVFENNTSAHYGGAFDLWCELTVRNTSFSGNTAEAEGGGAVNTNRGAEIVLCEFVDNEAAYGGAIRFNSGTSRIVNSTIYGNRTSGIGGGVYVASGETSLVNCTIAGNTAATSSGGVYNQGTLKASNSIISQNWAVSEADASGGLNVVSRNIIAADPCFVAGPEFDEEGKLTNLASLDLHLTERSRAIDAGDGTLVETGADLEGNARVVRSWTTVPTVDMGAYEFQGQFDKTPETPSLVVTTAEDSFDDCDGLVSLREALYYASEGETITFAPQLKGQTISLTSQLYLPTGTTVDASELWDDEQNAPGLKVSGEEKTRVFSASGDAAFIGLEISRGHAENGAAIYSVAGGSLAIEKCVFTENASASYGGAVRVVGVDLTIKDSVFSGNSAGKEGGAVKTDQGSVQISGSTFTGNTAASVGGAAQFYWASSIDISDSTFTGNASKGDGGAAYATGGKISISSSVFTENEASGNGGALRTFLDTELKIENSQFTGNKGASGGAMHFVSHAVRNIADSTFTGNQASRDGGVAGTSLLTYNGETSGGTLVIENSVFEDNSSSFYGGAFDLWSALTVRNSLFSGNTTESQGGGAINTNRDAEIILCEFVDNEAAYGGAIRSSSGTVRVVNSAIYGNRASGYGGGICVSSGKTTLVNCTVAGNTAKSSGGVSNKGTLSVFNSIISQNWAESDADVGGGANAVSRSFIAMDPAFATKPEFNEEGQLTNLGTLDLRLTDNSFAIDAGDGTLVETDVDLDGNARVVRSWATVPTVDVGAYEYQRQTEKSRETPSTVVTTTEDSFNPFDGQISLREAIFYALDGDTITFAPQLKGQTIALSNELQLPAGTTIDASKLWNDEQDAPGLTISGEEKTRVFSASGDATFIGLEISRGQAEDGAAIYSVAGGSLAIEKCVFTDNASASYGGAVRVVGVDLTIKDSVFSGNSAGEEGGAVKTDQGSVRISGTTFTANTATSVGGAARFYWASTIEISNSTFTGNASESSGGAAYASGGNLSITSSVFTENTASGNGGAVMTIADSGVSIADSEFIGNKGGNGGGAYFASHSVKTVVGSTFTGNEAVSGGGGAIRTNNLTSGDITHGGTFVIEDSVFDGNHSAIDGGALELFSALTVRNTLFSRNAADARGGGAINTKEDAEIILCEFVDNEATYGGAISVNGGSTRVVGAAIYGNRASKRGGGVYVASGEMTLVNCTIAGNTAETYGGGASNTRDINIFNSIISQNWANWDADVDGDARESSHNLIALDPRFVKGPEFDENGQLTNLAELDLRLTVGSRAIDSGDTALVETDADLDGKARVVQCWSTEPTVDIGAYEYQEKEERETPSLVVTTTEDSYDASDGLISLREAILYASEGDIITFAPQLKGQTIAPTNELQLPAGITIDASELWDDEKNAPGLTISGEKKIRVFSTSGDARFVGLEISNGHAENGAAIYSVLGGSLVIEKCVLTENASSTYGGAVRVVGVDLTIKDSVFSGSSSGKEGGAVKTDQGSVLISGTTFTGNTATSVGGAAQFYQASSIEISNSVFMENTSESSGGAVYASGDVITITTSVFSENTAPGNGGAVMLDGESGILIAGSEFIDNTGWSGGAAYLLSQSVINITGSTFIRNEASYGGAVNTNVDAEIVLCEFVDNEATYGGAIRFNGGMTRVVNSAIYGNRASNVGGGVYVASGETTLVNCTIAGNTAKNFGGVYNQGKLNVFNSIISQNWAESDDDVGANLNLASHNFIDADPYFANGPEYDENGRLTNLAELDLRLKAGSRAIDAGDTALIETDTDLDGKTRVVQCWTTEPTVDIGAYEFQEKDNREMPSLIVTTAEDCDDVLDGLISLREAILYASEGDTITFAPQLKGQTIALTSELQLPSGIMIDASELWDDEQNLPGLTVAGGKKTRVFSASGNARFVGLEISQGLAENGAAIYNVSGGALVIEKCVFTENASSSYGGAVRVVGVDLTIRDSVFSGNSAEKEGGAVKTDQGSVLISGTTFYGNTATSVGGAAQFYYATSVDVSSSMFTENASESNGGAAYVAGGVISITSSVFTENTASGNGGAVMTIADSGVSIADSEFTGNKGTRGGAAYVSSQVLKTITGTTFNDNQATFGGAIYTNPITSGGTTAAGTLVVEDSVFDGNSSDSSGGAVYLRSDLILRNTRFSGNASDYGGAAYLDSDSVSITSSVFAENTATSNGGALASRTDNGVSIADSEFTGNKGKYGGAVAYFSSRSVKTITGSTFTGNEAASGGGAVYANDLTVDGVTYGGVLVVENSAFKDNKSVNYGGAFDLWSELTVRNSSFSGNAAESQGGGAINTNRDAEIALCEFVDNTGAYGGAIRFNGGASSILSSTVHGNVASGDGGGIYAASANLKVSDSSISNNTASGNGGGMCVSGNLEATGSAISNNVTSSLESKTRVYGGGVYVKGDAALNDVTISNNTAYVEDSTSFSKYAYGGGLYIEGKLSAARCTVEGNTAESSGTNAYVYAGGGGIYANGTFNLADCRIESNRSFADGKATYLYGGGVYAIGTGTFVCSSFLKNSAQGLAHGSYCNVFGGGLCLGSGTSIPHAFVSCLIAENTASADADNASYANAYGGGASIDSATNFVCCTVTTNTAKTGGGVFMYAGSSLAFSNSIVAQNFAETDIDIGKYRNDFKISSNYTLSSFASWSNEEATGIVFDPSRSLFEDASRSNYRLAPDSQAGDMGDNSLVPEEATLDLDGNLRIRGNVDLGAYERQNYFGSSMRGVVQGENVLSWDMTSLLDGSVTISWFANGIKTILGEFDLSGNFVWDTTSVENASGAIIIEGVMPSGKKYESEIEAKILNGARIWQGKITEDVVFDKDTIHIVSGTLEIANGASVEIEKGAIVKFASNSKFSVSSGAALIVKDDAIITRLEDDSVGGDTNLDGSCSTPKTGDGYFTGTGSIQVADSADLRYVAFETSGVLKTDQTFLSGRTYYIKSTLTVPSGVTMTILPGAVLKFASRAAISVASGGKLEALGSVSKPIVFTSAYDPEYGGSVVDAANVRAPQPGDWGRISCDGGTVSMSHCIVRYCSDTSGAWGGLNVTYGTMSFDNSVLEYTKYYGVNFTQSGCIFTAQNSVFRENDTCMFNFHGYYGGFAKLTNCTVSNVLNLVNIGYNYRNSFINCIIANVSSSFERLGSSINYWNCVFWNPKGVGPQSFRQVGRNGNIWANPLFRDAENGDYRLTAGSPCIDAADGKAAPETDALGTPRYDDPYVENTGTATSTGAYADIGAYELADDASSNLDIEPVGLMTAPKAETGGELTVQWTLLNSGTSEINGTWSDAFYLITDQGERIFIQEVSHAALIVSGDTKTFQTTLRLPNVVEGTYRVEVQANSDRGLYEGYNNQNNSLVAASAVEIAMPEAALPIAALALNVGEERAYKLTVPAGETFCLVADSEDVVVRARENYAPTTALYDLKSATNDGKSYVRFDAAETDRVFYFTVSASDQALTVSLTKESDVAEPVVEPDKGYDLSHVATKLDCPVTRVGRVASANLIVTNNGDYPVYAPQVILMTQYYNSMAWTREELETGGTSVLKALALSGNGDVGILKAGESITIPFTYVYQSGMRLSAQVYSVAGEKVYDSSTNAIWPLYSDYSEALRDAAATFASRGKTVFDVTQLESFARTKATGGECAGVSGSIVTVGTGSPVANQRIQASWTTIDDDGEETTTSVYATTDATGSFCFDYLPTTDALTLCVPSDEIELTLDLSDGADRTGVVIPVAPKLALTGRVRNENNVMQPDVFVSAVDSNGRAFQVTTDALGQYAFTELYAGEWTISLVGEGVYACVEDQILVLNQPTTRLDFEVEVGVALSGVIADDSGKGVRNAVLFLSNSSGYSEYRVSESDGSFEFTPVARGEYRLTVYDVSMKVLSSRTVELTESTSLDVLSEKTADSVCSGRVVTSGGKPVSGLSVIYSSAYNTATAITDENGAFSFSDLVDAPYSLTIAELDITREYDGSEIDASFVLPYAAVLEGSFTKDASLEDAVLYVRQNGATKEFNLRDSSFRMLFAEAGEAEIWLCSNSGTTAPERIELQPGVNSWNPAFGSGSVQFRLSGLDAEAETVGWMLEMLDDSGTVAGAAYGRQTGTKDFSVSKLAAGSYRLIAYSDDLRAETEFAVSGSGKATVDLTFRKGVFRATIELSCPVGTVASGAETRVFAYSEDGTLVGSCVCDENGVGVLTTSAVGRYALVCFSGDFVGSSQITIGEDDSTARVELSLASRFVKGRALFNGEPAEEAIVVVKDANGTIVGCGYADADGYFRIAVLESDACVLSVVGSDSGEYVSEFAMSDSEYDAGTVELPEAAVGDDSVVLCDQSQDYADFINFDDIASIDFSEFFGIDELNRSGYLVFNPLDRITFSDHFYKSLSERYNSLLRELSKYSELTAECTCDAHAVGVYNQTLAQMRAEFADVKQKLAELQALERSQPGLLVDIGLDVAQIALNIAPQTLPFKILRIAVAGGTVVKNAADLWNIFREAGRLEGWDYWNVADFSLGLRDLFNQFVGEYKSVGSGLLRAMARLNLRNLTQQGIRDFVDACEPYMLRLVNQQETVQNAVDKVFNSVFNGKFRAPNTDLERSLRRAFSNFSDSVKSFFSAANVFLDFFGLIVDLGSMLEQGEQHTNLANDAYSALTIRIPSDISSLKTWKGYAVCNCSYCYCIKPICQCLSTGRCTGGSTCSCGCKARDKDKNPPDPPESTDPNEICGPEGADFVWHDAGTEDEPYIVIDGANWTDQTDQQFTIYFENKSDATAAAQEVFVNMTLPEEFDASTLTLGTISVGNEIFHLTPEYQIADNVWLFSQQSTGDLLKATFAFDPETRVASWYLRSYVVSTIDHFPASAYAGFLPPNDKSVGDGEGCVSFSVSLKDGVSSGTRIETGATIIFDTNDPIDTNIWVNTLDFDAPSAEIVSTKFNDTTQMIDVEWLGEDAFSGVAAYDVYYSVDGGEFYSLWLSQTTETSGSFGIESDGEYLFKVVAFDALGHSSEGVVAKIAVESNGPVVQLGESTYVVQEGCDVFVSALASEGEGLTYYWNLSDNEFESLDDYVEGDASFLISTSENSLAEGEYPIRLRVRNAAGIYSLPTRATLRVEHAAPSFAVDSESMLAGHGLRVDIAASTPYGEPVAEWRVHWGDGEITTVQALGDAISLAHVYAEEAEGVAYSVQLEAIDAQGRGEGELFYLLRHVVGLMEEAVDEMQNALDSVAAAVEGSPAPMSEEHGGCCGSEPAQPKQEDSSCCHSSCCGSQAIPVVLEEEDDCCHSEPETGEAAPAATVALLARFAELFETAGVQLDDAQAFQTNSSGDYALTQPLAQPVEAFDFAELAELGEAFDEFDAFEPAALDWALDPELAVLVEFEEAFVEI